MTKKNENRGGKREGAGRKHNPPKEYSDEFKRGLLAACEKKAKDTGKTIYDVAVEMFYEKRTQAAVRSGLFKIMAEIMTVKESTQNINKSSYGEVIMLPPVQETPDEFKKLEKDYKKQVEHGLKGRA